MPEIHGRSEIAVIEKGFAKSAENSGETSGGERERRLKRASMRRGRGLARVCVWKIKRVKGGSRKGLGTWEWPHSHLFPTLNT